MHAAILFLKTLVQTYGLKAIFSLSVIEQFFLPLPVEIFMTIGAASGLTLKKMLPIILMGALIGSITGYALGKYLGHPLALRLFGEKQVNKGESVIKKWGVWGVFIAGLTPIPFQPVTWCAGIFEMPFKKYLLAVILGRIPRYILTAYATTFIISHKLYATPLISAAILGVLQGVTEFLPISSSGHLALVEHFMKIPFSKDQMVFFDIFIHLGSLLAILLYFWKDWLSIPKEIWKMIKEKKVMHETLTFKLILGTIPAVIVGLAFGNYFANNLRSLQAVAITFIIMGLFFFYAEWKSKKSTLEHVTNLKALLIGVAQTLALPSGISRSGSTIGFGMILGLKREVVARFSFMLGGVAILAANVYSLMFLEPTLKMPLPFLAVGFITTFFSSLLVIKTLLKYLRHHTLRPFGVYLIILGSLILTVLVR